MEQNEEDILCQSLSFGFGVLGMRAIRALKTIVPCDLLINAFSPSDSLSTYLSTCTVYSILVPYMNNNKNFATLREFFLSCKKGEKRKLRGKTLLLDWPDTSGSDLELVQHFRPDYIAIVFCHSISGSQKLLDFLATKTNWKKQTKKNVKYEVIYHIDRVCGLLDGSTRKVEFLILKRPFLSGPAVFKESWNPVLLFF